MKKQAIELDYCNMTGILYCNGVALVRESINEMAEALVQMNAAMEDAMQYINKPGMQFQAEPIIHFVDTVNETEHNFTQQDIVECISYIDEHGYEIANRADFQ